VVYFLKIESFSEDFLSWFWKRNSYCFRRVNSFFCDAQQKQSKKQSTNRMKEIISWKCTFDFCFDLTILSGRWFTQKKWLIVRCSSYLHLSNFADKWNKNEEFILRICFCFISRQMREIIANGSSWKNYFFR